MIVNAESGTSLHEVAHGIYRISTPVALPGDLGHFSFNQYLIAAHAPLLYHTGPRRMFPLVREAVSRVMPAANLRYLAFSHFEADECGALNEWLASAPEAVPVCGRIGAMTSVGDVADRPPRPLADGETLDLGDHRVRWFDTPHMPHGWDCGSLFEENTRTLFCGDLFTQGGRGETPLTEGDILGPSELFRQPMDYYSHAPNSTALLDRLAEQRPTTLACMHGSAWRGDGATLLRSLAERLEAPLSSGAGRLSL